MKLTKKQHLEDYYFNKLDRIALKLMTSQLNDTLVEGLEDRIEYLEAKIRYYITTIRE